MQSTFQTLTDFATEIDRRENEKQDYVIPASNLALTIGDKVSFSGKSLSVPDNSQASKRRQHS